MGRFVDRVAIVTGAGGGLGREYALALAAEGAAVVINDLGADLDGSGASAGRAQDVVNEILSHGGRAVANYDDVSVWPSAERIIQTAYENFGNLHIVVNNAGVNHQHRLTSLREDEFDAEIGVHLKGTFAISHFAAAAWATQGHQQGRAIINTTSAAGLHPPSGAGVYGAAKAGVASATLAHAQELAPLGVRVNAVAPCARTRMVENSPLVNAMMPIPTEGFDRHLPAHVAPLIVYLASDVNRFTGRVFAIEGPDVAIYRPFSVEHEFTTNQTWSIDALEDAFREIPQQSLVASFLPNGVVTLPVPPGKTLRAITHGR